MLMIDRIPLRLSRAGLAAVVLLGLAAPPAGSAAGVTPAAVEEAPVGRRLTPAFIPAAAPEPTGDRQPPEVRALLQQYQADEAAARRAAAAQASLRKRILLAQLNRLASHYNSLGDARAVAAIRQHIRQLGGTATGLGGPVGPAANRPLPEPGDLSAYRGRVGATLLFGVEGRASGAVWGGPDAYTDDSTLAAAAVHAGVLQPGERGVVRVEILPGRESYAGSTCNGVQSMSYGAWPGSFRVSSVSGGDVRPDPGTLGSFRGQVGASLLFRVTGNPKAGTVWGSDVYTDDSPVAAAAVHAGVLQPGEAGVVRVTILPGQASYEGSTRNGVTTSSYNSFGGSYRVERAAGAAAAGQPAPPVFGPAPGTPPGTTPGVPGLAPMPGGPAAPELPRPSFGEHRGQAGREFTFEVIGSTEGPVWGTEIYTDDSRPGTAAVHAGLVSVGERATVKVTLLPGRSSYKGSARNGVTSSDYGPWGGSYVIERVDGNAQPAAPPPPPVRQLRGYSEPPGAAAPQPPTLESR